MRLKAGPTWDNVEQSDLVWARKTRGRIAGQCAGGGGGQRLLPSTNYSQVAPKTLLRRSSANKNWSLTIKPHYHYLDL